MRDRTAGQQTQTAARLINPPLTPRQLRHARPCTDHAPVIQVQSRDNGPPISRPNLRQAVRQYQIAPPAELRIATHRQVLPRQTEQVYRNHQHQPLTPPGNAG